MEDSEVADWHAGDVILNLYEVKGLLGQGGMGKVYKVYHRAWQIDLAVKCPKPGVLARAGGFENFERECETWVNLGLHPHTVSCYYVRQIENLPRIFAEYVSGGSLWHWLDKGKVHNAGPEKALERTLSIAIQTAWGLHHAHEMGLIHRDVKTPNIMMTPDGVAKVTDFGLAKALATQAPVELPRDTDQPIVAGIRGMTPAYCSPEQAKAQELTRGTDIWSWGLCVLEMLVGRVFWRTGLEAPQALRYLLSEVATAARVPRVPPSLAKLLGRCFSFKPEARPTSMLEVADTLLEIYQEVTGQRYPGKTPKSIEGRAESLNNRAVSFMDLGKEDEAKRCWNEALNVSPHHAESTFNLGLLRWRAGQVTDEAFLYRLREVSVSHSGDPLPLYLTAQAHLERGDWKSSIALLEEHKDVEPYAQDIAALLEMARARYRGSRRLLRNCQGHADCVNAVCFHPDGTHGVSSSEDNTIRLWDLVLGRCIRMFEGHSGSVQALAISPDGNRLLSASEDRTLRMWDIATGQCLHTYEGHTGAVTSVVFSSDGAHALSGGTDRAALLWRLDLGHPTKALKGHTGVITGVSLSHDRGWAASSGADGSVRLWNLGTGRMTRMIEAHKSGVQAVWLASDAQVVLSGGRDGAICMWHVEDGQCLRVFEGHHDAVEAVVMTADGRYVLSGSKDATVRIWESATGRCLCTFDRHTGRVTSIALNKDGSLILSGSQDTTVKVWCMGSSAITYLAPLVLCRALESEKALTTESAFNAALERAREAMAKDAVTAAAHVRKARALPGYEREGEAMNEWFRLYLKLPKKSIEGAWEGVTFQGHGGPVRSACLNSDGHYLVSASADTTLKLWETATGECLHTLEGHASAVNSVSLTENGRFALSADDDGTLALWDLREGQLKLLFEEFSGSIESVCISSDGRFAVSVGWEIKLWDTATGRRIRSFKRHPAGALAVFISREGQFMLTGGSEGALDLWDIAGGNRMRSFQGHMGSVRCVHLSTDGKRALSASSDPWRQASELMLWDVDSAKCVRTFEGHPSAIKAAVLSEDSRFVLSGHKDSSLMLWDVESGEPIRTLKGHRDSIDAVCLARDGRFALSASADGTLKTWVLDWELEDKEVALWHDGAQPYLNSFVLQHTPWAAELPAESEASQKEIVHALTRRSRATWTGEDFHKLLDMLGWAGYGWLDPEGVHAHLERTARKAGSISFVPPL